MFVLKNGMTLLSSLLPADYPKIVHSNTSSPQSVGKLLFGSSGNTETVLEIPQGQLYLVRPISPKGYSELIFRDSVVQIRRTTQDFNYQLVIQRAYEEGEAELSEHEADDDGIVGFEGDEKIFLLDEQLHLRVENRPGSEKVICWRDLNGDAGDVYEFVCDPSVHSSLVDQFGLVARQCQYERKYRKPHATASDKILAQFEFDEQPIPPASPIHSPATTWPIATSLDDVDDMYASTSSAGPSKATPPETPGRRDKEKKPLTPGSPPTPQDAPQALEILAAEAGELHFFDFPSASFVLQDPSTTAMVSEIGAWQYWLAISGREKDWLGMKISPQMNPVFNFEYLSFIFNQFTADGRAYSWLIRFKDQVILERFQEGLLRALWEQLNEIKWAKMKDKERDYVADAFKELEMENAPDDGEDDQDQDDEEEIQEGEAHDHRRIRDGEVYSDSDDDDGDDDGKAPDDGLYNSQLAVGYKHDRSFVVRGSKIGVFKHTPDNNLEFSTSISKVQTPKGNLFSPKKLMLHKEDRNMILQNPADAHSLYCMDLEHGKVVDEWKVHDDIPIMTFAPDNKFAQMTHEPTFLGLSHNALYRVDPRQGGNKLVKSQMQQYVTKNDFSSLATTEKGYIAVASNKGDIRLFDRLGIRAKTHIPALGEPIIGMDVSADGRWVLATCKTYLLLIDAEQKSGKFQGKVGFERSFSADSKPQPRRLALAPEHVAQFCFETGKGVSFTPAKFNTGQYSKETSIITATGPYIVEWNLKKLLDSSKSSYMIKRYREDVMADDFKFGTDRNVIVALPNEVNMVGKQALKKPTRQSIAGDFGPSRRMSGTPRQSATTRHSMSEHLGRNDIVHSPY